MLTITKKHTSEDVNTQLGETYYYTTYETAGKVKLAGDSIWGYKGADEVAVDSIQVIETVYDDGATSTMVNVTHDTTWDIYTDTGFEAAISKALGFDVAFTEQGMQDDGYASMET